MPSGGVDPLLDEGRLARWMDGLGIERGAPIEATRVTGGASNAMFRLRRGAHRSILRRPARVSHARADAGMRREHRMLSALDGTGVPHPSPIALCDDPDVLGCTFYLMQDVEGFCPLPSALPEAFSDGEGRRAVAGVLIDALADLHAVDWRAAGLEDLDRTEGFHERQVSRWMGELDTDEGRKIQGLDRVATWLDTHRPESFEPTIMHGDYHMLNVLLAPEPPARVAAILDWETATIGDPLLDLAGFCEIWCPIASPADGWPSRQELVDRYAARRGVETGSLTYHEVLYNLRMTVLLEGIYQRSLQDPTREPMDAIGQRALTVAARALEIVETDG